MRRQLITQRRRGAVMIEFVFCLPFLGFILALIFFFGWSMMNLQNVKAAARHTAWRSVRGPAGTTGLELRADFFNQSSSGETVGVGPGPDTTLQQYVTAASAAGNSAGVLASDLVLNQFPRGSAADVNSSFLSSVALWQQFQGGIDSKMARDGVEWRYRQTAPEGTFKDVFLQPLDNMLGNVAAPGKDMGTTFQSLYLAHW